MKKIASLFCFLLFAAHFALAQDAQAQAFRLGFQTSPTWSWMNTSDKRLEGVGSNWGLKLGALFDYYFTTKLAFTTGLGFGFNQGGNIQNGYETASLWPKSELSNEIFRVVPSNTKLHYRLTYVEIPLGLKMRTGSEKQLEYYIEAPVFTLGFLTRAQGDIRGTDPSTEDEDIRKDVKGLSLAWGFGAGVEYLLGSVRAVGGFVFQKQFTDATGDGNVQKVNGDPTLTADKSKGNIGLFGLRLAVFF